MAVVTPTIAEIFEEAYERAGLQLRNGYQLKTARRTLNFLLLEWQNRGLNLFTVEEGTLPLVQGVETYTMPDDTIDLIEHQVRTGTGQSQIDRGLMRVSVSTRAKQGSKNTTGAPSQIYVDRQASAVNVTLWPVPDSSKYTLYYYRLKGIDGVSGGISGSAAVPPRFVPCLTAGIAYMVALKDPEAAVRAPALKQEYEEQYRLAAEEDQDSSTYTIQPWVGPI